MLPPNAPSLSAGLRIDTEQEKGYEHILGQIKLLLERMQNESKTAPAAIGVAHPGVLDPKKLLLKNSNTQCLNGKPLKQDLEAILGIPVHLANDANCFALAEACFGAGQGCDVVFGVIMGTGVGGGIVISRKAHFGAQGIAGEWGHNIVNPDGPPCYCGRRGCVERMISGPVSEELYQSISGKRLRLAEIVSFARVGSDDAAVKTVAHLTSWFGRSIAQVINILDPNCIVLGGGLSNIDELYEAGRAEAAKYVFNDSLETRIVRNMLGDSAGVFGAALLSA